MAEFRYVFHDRQVIHRVYVRGSKQVNYGRIAEVMAIITTSGFKKVALITESNKK